MSRMFSKLRTRRNHVIAIASALATTGACVVTGGFSLFGSAAYWVAVPTFLFGLVMTAIIIVAAFLPPAGIEGPRELSIEDAASLVALAISPSTKRICAHAAADHASGAAIMSVLGQHLQDGLKRVYGVMDVTAGELRDETCFDLRTVVGHLHKYGKAYHRAVGVLASSSAKQFFLKTHKGLAVKQALLELERSLRSAVYPMFLDLIRESPRDAVWDRPHPTYAKTIEDAITKHIPNEIDKIRRGVATLARANRIMTEAIGAFQADWHLDVEQIRRDGVCSP